MDALTTELLEAARKALAALQNPTPLRNANAIYALRTAIAHAEGRR